LSAILKDLAGLLGIDPATALMIIIVISTLGTVVAFAYKENLFGLKKRIVKRGQPLTWDIFKVICGSGR